MKMYKKLALLFMGSLMLPSLSLQGAVNITANSPESMAAGMGVYALVAPIAGLVLGYERRALNRMEQHVKNQISNDAAQVETLQNMYSNLKIDTTPYTTATGPLSLLSLGGATTAFMMRSPIVGGIVAVVGCVGSFVALGFAGSAQVLNTSRYEDAVKQINLQRALKNQPAVLGDAALTDIEKILLMKKPAMRN